MLTHSILLTLVLGSAPGLIHSPDAGDLICSPLPPAPQRIDAHPFASTTVDGTRTWGAEATYELSSGDIGEAFVVIDELGAGEAQLMINGEIIAHVAVEATSSPAPVLTTWMPAMVNAAPESIAEMMRIDLPAIVADSIPQEFKCSSWAKKALKAGRYLWIGAVAASNAICCLPPATLACPACLGANAVVGTYVSEKMKNHCD